MRKRIAETYPDKKPGALSGNASMAFKFKDGIKRGDRVVSYDPPNREYLVGTIVGDYEFKPNTVPDYPHIRRVEWQGRVDRDTVEALLRLMPLNRAVGEVINIGNTEEVTIENLAKIVKHRTGSDSPIRFVPYDKAYEPGFEDMMRRVPSIEKLHSLTGFRPQTNLADIIDRVAAYFRQKGAAEEVKKLTSVKAV